MPKHIPRVAAIHDISGFGRCSITVALPALSAMGVECCVLPTAYLSNHTAFPQFTFVDMTEHMRPALEHWKKLDLRFDAVYSGFLGSAEQIDIVRECIRDFRGSNTLAVVDPVMGDHGKPYPTYTPDMCRKMVTLAEEADLITPNLTEASLLLDEPFSKAPRGEAAAREWLGRLSGDGKRAVVLTGYSTREKFIGAAFVEKGGEPGFLELPFVGGEYHGTGDLFSSVLLGSLLRGQNLPQAVESAAVFVGACAGVTAAEGREAYGSVRFEPLLGRLAAPYSSSSSICSSGASSEADHS